MTISLIVLGFFFFTIALIAGVVLAAVFGARLWWTLRKLKQQVKDARVRADDTVVEGDYQVIEREVSVTRLPPGSGRNP